MQSRRFPSLYSLPRLDEIELGAYWCYVVQLRLLLPKVKLTLEILAMIGLV